MIIHQMHISLVLFPILEPLANWTAYDRQTREYLLDAAEKLELVVIDIQPVAEQMISAGIDPKKDRETHCTPTIAWGKRRQNTSSREHARSSVSNHVGNINPIPI